MIKVVSFHGTCSASDVKTLVSKRIGTPFVVKEISARFAQGCNNMLAVRIYTSGDSDAPAAGQPSGVSLLRDYGQADYIVGNDDTKEMRHEVEVDEGGTYLKVHGTNTDAFDHTLDVQVEIEIDGSD
jgi:hypothetical protein